MESGTKLGHCEVLSLLGKGGLIVLATLLIPSTTLYSQEPGANTKVVIATYTESLISIDGSLTESA